MNKTAMNITIEWAPFEIAEHVSDEQFLEAAAKLETDFLQGQDGYLRRELLRGEGRQWVDLVYWSSMETATKAAHAANESDACSRYFSLMDGVEDAVDGIFHYKQIKTWN